MTGASLDSLERVHPREYLERLAATAAAGGGRLDPDTVMNAGSWDAALGSAGAALAALDSALRGVPSFAAGRPPGHHALAASAMGFCLVANVVVAAREAQARGAGRVLIIDWDVHHGNGTQDTFLADPSVLYVSTHQFPFYPGTGAVLETGEGAGKGYTVNVPLTAGGGDGIYRAAFERIILPVLEEYKPELILVSAGFDASARDPLAEMTLSADAFGWMARALRVAADRDAQGRIALVLEGGYDLVALESGLLAATRGMVEGTAVEIARDPDSDDVARASDVARDTWRTAG